MNFDYDTFRIGRNLHVIIKGSPGAPGEIRDAYAVVFPQSDRGTDHTLDFLTDDSGTASHLADTAQLGFYGTSGRVLPCQIVCVTPGQLWSPVFPTPTIDHIDAFERSKAKQKALAKLTPEERTLLGLA